MNLSDELAPYRQTIEAALRPAIRLEPPAPPSGAAAQYGGTPLVPPGATWPQGERGPMRFVGHLDFAQIQRQAGLAAADLPDDGILALFVDPHRWPGDSRQGDRWVLLHTPRSADAVRLAVPQPILSPRRRFPLSLFSPKPKPFSGPELRLGASAVDSLPTYDETEGLIAIPEGADELWDRYFEELLPPDHAECHQLLGYARWIQFDRRGTLEALSRGLRDRAAYDGPQAAEIQAAGRRWRLLWQIDSDRRAGSMWGDAGQIYLLVTAEDLAARRFERAWMIFDCY